jgi:hypothetical protein
MGSLLTGYAGDANPMPTKKAEPKLRMVFEKWMGF